MSALVFLKVPSSVNSNDSRKFLGVDFNVSGSEARSIWIGLQSADCGWGWGWGLGVEMVNPHGESGEPLICDFLFR